jgi:hypothetical protein
MPIINWSLLLFLCFILFGIQQTTNPPLTSPEKTSQASSSLILLYEALPDTASNIQLQPLRVEPWVLIGQDEASYKTGLIDIDSIAKQVLTRTRGIPPTWMMLDFEDPFFANLDKDPNSPERQATIQTMVAAIRAMKARWPESKWTFYGIPNLPYWIQGKGWASVTTEQKRDVLQRVADAAAPLVAESDWVSVSIYDYYDTRMLVRGSPDSIRGTPESVRADGRAWRMARVELAKLLAKGKPVIPNVCPFWVPGGIAPYCHLIQPRLFIEDQIIPAMEAGAKGFALWTGTNYLIQIATQADDQGGKTKTEDNFGIKEWRKAFTQDYFDGREPTNWNDPQVHRKLSIDTSRSTIETLTNIRAWETKKILPPLTGDLGKEPPPMKNQ